MTHDTQRNIVIEHKEVPADVLSLAYADDSWICYRQKSSLLDQNIYWVYEIVGNKQRRISDPLASLNLGISLIEMVKAEQVRGVNFDRTI